MHNLQGGISDYNCTCVAGWEGQNCDIDTNDCILNPCENGATCIVRRDNNYLFILHKISLQIILCSNGKYEMYV